MNMNDINRVAAVVSKMDLLLEHVSPTDQEAMYETANLPTTTWVDLGDKASLAVAHGLVTLPEANTLYRIHTGWDSATLAERITYLVVIHEVLAAV